MSKYNKGRFIFMFDPISKQLAGIYDTTYDTPYVKEHMSFMDVFKKAIKTLDDEALKELMEKIKDEPMLTQNIENVIFNRKNDK